MRRLNKLLTPALLAGFSIAAQETPVFRAETRLVLLHASVVDRGGRLLVNLPQKAFKVYEDGVEQQIKLFRREDIPVALGLVIDSSGSMRDKRPKVERAALALVKASNPQDQVFIVNFNDEAFLDTPFTNDIKKMEEGLAQIDARGGTAMRDAISLAIDYMKEEAKLDKKVLVVITDGNDNTSSIPLERLVKKAHDSEILIYAIGLLSEEERREAKRAKRALDALTSASGGLAYYPKELEEVHQIALLVANEIRNQYVIGYTPARQELDGTFRQIRVTVDAPGRPTVRTRSGYYATADGPRKASSFRPGREATTR